VINFASRITRHPIPFDPERGDEGLAQLPGLPSELRPLIRGTAGCSPYLARLIRQEAAWLNEILTLEPETTLSDILGATIAQAGSDLKPGLRRQKRRIALLAALADLGGVWDLETVTAALTDFADAATRAAITTHVAAEITHGKLPGISDEGEAATGAGLVVLAMGKMGARELNYSSDIDLICLFDETRFDPTDETEARTSFIRATRRIAASLSENTADGYVFRTDLRLRPDAGSTPVCMSMAAAERYYEAEGRSWERGAYIKARVAAGDVQAGHRFLTTMVPFVWRKYLDFSMIRDMDDMRQRIRSHKGLHGAITPEAHDIKLGAGGIREIEFFAQARQLVAGGRDPDLRLRGTVPALAMLAQKGWITAETAAELTTHYRAHREIEHRLQMISDAQTQTLPSTSEGFHRLARFCGAGDTGAFRRDLAARLALVDGITRPFFAPDPRAVPEPVLSTTVRDIVERWPGYPALRSTRGKEIFARLRPDLLARFQSAAKPEEALSNFDGFLRGLPAGVQLFSLFEAHPPLVDLIVDISATAPGLARYLSRHSSVLDAVLGGSFFTPWPEAGELASDLRERLAGQDFEAQLDAARHWQKDWHFRIGVHHLRGLITAEEAGAQYSALADAVVAGLWPVVMDDIARRHGSAPGRGAAVLGMGSLGAGCLSARSDLDLIVIYDATGIEMTKGHRPLDPRAWFAKATRALVTALSVPTPAGNLYEVDMRLRPSGRQGPVATGLAAFRRYQMTEAWTWEHMALTRTRPVAGAVDLLADIEAVRRGVLAAERGAASVLAGARHMRARLQAAGRSGDAWAVKEGPGGARDIELLGQAAALTAGAPARDLAGQMVAMGKLGWLTGAEVASLCATYALYTRVNQAVRLLTDQELDLEEIGTGGQAVLCREGGCDSPEELTELLDASRVEAAEVISRVYTAHASTPPIPPSSEPKMP